MTVSHSPLQARAVMVDSNANTSLTCATPAPDRTTTGATHAIRQEITPRRLRNCTLAAAQNGLANMATYRAFWATQPAQKRVFGPGVDLGSSAATPPRAVAARITLLHPQDVTFNFSRIEPCFVQTPPTVGRRSRGDQPSAESNSTLARSGPDLDEINPTLSGIPPKFGRNKV